MTPLLKCPPNATCHAATKKDLKNVLTRLLCPDETIELKGGIIGASPCGHVTGHLCSFLILVRTVFRYSHGFYLFLILAQILRFSDTHTDSTIFRYSSGQFFGSGTDSTFSGYSPEFYHFSVLTLILPFFDTRPDSFSIVARILPFPCTRPDSTIFRYSH